MTADAILFLLLSWTAVLGLTTWAYRRILRTPPPRTEDHEPS